MDGREAEWKSSPLLLGVDLVGLGVLVVVLMSITLSHTALHSSSELRTKVLHVSAQSSKCVIIQILACFKPESKAIRICVLSDWLSWRTCVASEKVDDFHCIASLPMGVFLSNE